MQKKIMGPNPVQVTVPGEWYGNAQCQANAAYFQRVTLTIGGVPVAFEGVGEGVQMTLPGGATTYPITTRGPSFVSCFFEFSPQGSGGPFSPASVLAPTYTQTPSGLFIQVTSEDSEDNDYNDSVLSFVPSASS